jgi:hypothetical protein
MESLKVKTGSLLPLIWDEDLPKEFKAGESKELCKITQPRPKHTKYI